MKLWIKNGPKNNQKMILIENEIIFDVVFFSLLTFGRITAQKAKFFGNSMDT